MFFKLSVLVFYVLFDSIQTSERNFYDDEILQNQQPADFIFQTISDIWDNELVKVQVFYESLCPGSRQFYTGMFIRTVEALSKNLDINVYPYGNAQTYEKKGRTVIKCQHGPEECYGNQLHACAQDILKNITQAVEYNSCLMDNSRGGHGSDDDAADLCGQKMKIDSDSIKECAKGDRGFRLLKYYGELSKPMGFIGVPYVLINGNEFQGDDLLEAVCKLYQNPPSACNNTTTQSADRK